MRMSSFIVGGMLGAAAAIYFNRNSKPLMYSLSQAGSSVNKMVDSAISRMNNKNMQSTASHTNLDDVEEILKEEPETKHKVDEILEENDEKTIQTH